MEDKHQLSFEREPDVFRFRFKRDAQKQFLPGWLSNE
jgi:hypothetical protein